MLFRNGNNNHSNRIYYPIIPPSMSLFSKLASLFYKSETPLEKEEKAEKANNNEKSSSESENKSSSEGKYSDINDKNLMASLQNISGTFDVHVTVDEGQIHLVNNFCNYNSIPLAYAIGKAGDYKQHLMTTSYYTNTTGEKAVQNAMELAAQMERYGINTLRIKVEALAQNKGVREFVETPAFKNNKQYYYEFHFKVTNRSEKDQTLIDEVCKKHHASYAINFLSKNRYDPLIAFRAKGTFEKANEANEQLKRAFEAAGVKTLMDGTHSEIAIFDTNYDLDANFVLDAIMV